MTQQLGLIRARIGGMELSEPELADLLETAADNQQLLEERLAELEFALEDRDWMRIDAEGGLNISSWVMLRIIDYARKSYISNPLINHGVEVRADYVWSQGFNIVAKEPEHNDTVQGFLNHPRNERVLTGHMARVERDRQIQLEGNMFITLVSGPNGDTVARVIPTEEILRGDIIPNPEDRAEIWFYQRQWTKRDGESVEDRKDLYPDIQYTPKQRPETYNGMPIHWDMPVVHIKDGGIPGAKFGLPTVYPSLDWAREVKRDLEAYATIRRALASFVWRVKTKGGKAGVASAKARLQADFEGTSDAPRLPNQNPAPAMGSYWIQSDGRDLEPIRTAGAQPAPDEGRRLWLMAAAGLGLPETILSGDADVGNLATAKTLDRPTELHMRNVQQNWAWAFRVILQYVILKKESGENMPDLSQPDLPVIDVSFPSILEPDVGALVGGIVSALTLDAKTPMEWASAKPKVVARLLFEALGIDDIDALLEEFFPEGEGAENVPTNLTTPAEEALTGAVRDLTAALGKRSNGTS